MVKELKNTAYRPTTAILGSKNQYCVNDKVCGGNVSIDEGCDAQLDTSKGCEYKNGARKFMTYMQHRPEMRVRCIVTIILKVCCLWLEESFKRPREVLFAILHACLAMVTFRENSCYCHLGNYSTR